MPHVLQLCIYFQKGGHRIISGFKKNRILIIKIENSYSKLEKMEGGTLLKTMCVYSPKVP